MELDIYQKLARKTAVYPKINSGDLTYCTLGLTGEAGEVAEKVKKIFRDKKGIINQEDKDALMKELGDVLWYISNIASELNVLLGDIAFINITKLNSRSARGTLCGNGDDR